jgi:hypothetical protein
MIFAAGFDQLRFSTIGVRQGVAMESLKFHPSQLAVPSYALPFYVLQEGHP